MRTARRISQVVFIILFFGFFLLATYPIASRVPVDLFLRSDPLLNTSASIANRSFILKSIPAFVLLLLTIIFGRFFRGWVCPLGATIDGFDGIAGNKPRNDRIPGMRWIKYALLIGILVAALFGLQLAGFFAPIPLLTRSTVTFLYPLFVLVTDGFMAFLMSFGFLEEFAFQFNELLRGTLLPLSINAFRGSVLIGLFFIVLLLLGFIQKRFWCRKLCPLGGLFGLFSAFRPYRRRVSDDCTECGLCSRICRMDAISPDYHGTDDLECISCMDCQAVCPANAIHFRFSGDKGPTSAPDLTRRRMLTAGAAGLLSVGVFKVGFSNPREEGFVVRPPGSMQEPDFLERCIRCGECIRVCSTSGAGLQYAMLESGWEGIWTPILIPKVGYCEYNCNLCGHVCPTGAIHPLDVEAKKEMKLGTAHFDKTRCIPWYYGENCMVCEEHCPLPDKAIKFRDEKLLTIDGREATVSLPYVDESLCIGCGICVNRCPVEGERGIFLTNAEEQRWIA